MRFDLRRPCANCPFRAKGAIHLQPGRLSGIVDSLGKDDYQTFPCHKTTTASGSPRGREQACMGAAAFMLRRGRMSVLTRVAVLCGRVSVDAIKSVFAELREDGDLGAPTKESRKRK